MHMIFCLFCMWFFYNSFERVVYFVCFTNRCTCSSADNMQNLKCKNSASNTLKTVDNFLKTLLNSTINDQDLLKIFKNKNFFCWKYNGNTKKYVIENVWQFWTNRTINSTQNPQIVEVRWTNHLEECLNVVRAHRWFTLSKPFGFIR